MVRDSYVIKANTFMMPEVPVMRAFSFSGCLGGKVIGGTNTSETHHINDEPDDILKDITKSQKVEKLLEYLFNTQIKALTYSEELDLISLGFRDGKIQSFYLNIEVDKEDAEPEEDLSDDELEHDYTDNSNITGPMGFNKNKAPKIIVQSINKGVKSKPK